MFRFTIRELLLLTVIVAMAVGWWSDHRLLRRELEEQRWFLQDLRLVTVPVYFGNSCEPWNNHMSPNYVRGEY